MSLIVDFAAATRRLDDDEFEVWAQGQTVFLSSVMSELASERRAVAEHLEPIGFSVRWFEEFGGRDDNAEDAYLSEVRSCTICLGLLADSYGTMLASGPYAGFSATHAEYLEARTQGKRISFWARSSAERRDGHARRFLMEVQGFHVTGSFDGADDLAGRVERRLREIAAEDLAPWVKFEDVIIRASRVGVDSNSISVLARIQDSAVRRALVEIVGERRGRRESAISYGDRSGVGRIANLSEASVSSAFTDVTIEAQVAWATGAEATAMGTSGYSADDLTEIAMRVGLLGEAIPDVLGRMTFLVDDSDPLAELPTMAIPEGAVQPLARLLLVERLVGGRRASAVERFSLGPTHGGERQLELSWSEPRRYSNVEPRVRSISGSRRWG
ncbi:MAG: DUF4062 domain-containing protein [Solirubrobacteraceae bacterium]